MFLRRPMLYVLKPVSFDLNIDSVHLMRNEHAKIFSIFIIG